MSFLSVITLKAIEKLPGEVVENGAEDFIDELKEAISGALKKHDMEFLCWEMMSHDLSVQNFSKCDNCSAWMLNRDKEETCGNVDENIKNGGEHQGKFLCSDCLPEEHAWSWKRI